MAGGRNHSNGKRGDAALEGEEGLAVASAPAWNGVRTGYMDDSLYRRHEYLWAGCLAKKLP